MAEVPHNGKRAVSYDVPAQARISERLLHRPGNDHVLFLSPVSSPTLNSLHTFVTSLYLCPSYVQKLLRVRGLQKFGLNCATLSSVPHGFQTFQCETSLLSLTLSVLCHTCIHSSISKTIKSNHSARPNQYQHDNNIIWLYHSCSARSDN